MKMYEFRLRFHWSLFLRFELTIGLDNGFAPNRRQAIIWTNADQIHWYIYEALGGDELSEHMLSQTSLPKERSCTATA